MDLAGKNIKPILRFEEFQISWVEKTIGEILSIGSGKDYKQLGEGNIPVYGSGGYMLSVDEYLYNGESVCIGRKGTINKPKLLSGKFWTVDTLFYTHQFKGVTPKHVYSIFLNINWKKYNEAGGVPSLSKSTIESIKIYLSPCKEEQQKIADFLSAVDKKISLLKQKHSLLQQHKKGIMQQLFSQRIRFKDDNGKAFPDWQEKTMADVLDQVIREIPKPNVNYLALGIRSHMKGTFQKPDFDPDSNIMDKLYVIKENDLVVNITFAWEGAIAIAKNIDEGGLVSHRFPTYVFKPSQTTHEYFKHIIQEKRFKYMLDLISPGGAGRNRVLSKKEFLKLKWNLPGIDEQKKIAKFLGVLDEKINLAAKQIELTQTFKKGLLQQMFV